MASLVVPRRAWPALAMLVAAAMTPGGAFHRAAALEFSLHDSQRCFEEEIHRELLVVGEYALHVNREDVTAVLRKLNSTESDRRHYGFIKRGEDLDALVSMLEPEKDLLRVPESEQQRQVIAYFGRRDEAFHALHADDERAIRGYQRREEEALANSSLRDLFLGLVHRRIDLPLRLTVADPAGERVLTKQGTGDASFTFNSKKPGVYRCCIEVMNSAGAPAGAPGQTGQRPREPLWPLVDNRGGGLTMGQLASYLAANGTPMRVNLRWQVGVQSAEWRPADARSGGAAEEAVGALSDKIFEIHNAMGEIEREMESYVLLYDKMVGGAERHEALIKWVGVLSCAVVALLSLGQIFFLKLFFKKRKLI